MVDLTLQKVIFQNGGNTTLVSGGNISPFSGDLGTNSRSRMGISMMPFAVTLSWRFAVNMNARVRK